MVEGLDAPYRSASRRNALAQCAYLRLVAALQVS